MKRTTLILAGIYLLLTVAWLLAYLLPVAWEVAQATAFFLGLMVALPAHDFEHFVDGGPGYVLALFQVELVYAFQKSSPAGFAGLAFFSHALRGGGNLAGLFLGIFLLLRESAAGRRLG